jgi:hypothetical protein
MNNSQAAFPRDGRSRSSMNSHREHMLLFYRRELAAARLKQFPSVPSERWRWYDVLWRQPWVWCVTLTFEYLVTPGQARKRWNEWVREVHGWERFERSYTPVTIQWALSTQLQSRRVASYRALVSGVLSTTGGTERSAIRNWECDRTGKITIIPYGRSLLEGFIAKGDVIEVSDPALAPQATPKD